jgi:hypothetical protein
MKSQTLFLIGLLLFSLGSFFTGVCIAKVVYFHEYTFSIYFFISVAITGAGHYMMEKRIKE